MIGRFCCLSVSNTVSIKSYYNGKCYSYLMYKDGETLNIDLLNTTDTQYDNGVEVSVNVKDAYYEKTHIIKGLALLCYFEQIYVDTDVEYLEDFIKRFNDRQIHEFYSFKVCSLPEVSGIHCLMGNVLYPLNNVDIIGESPDIAITCEIGELDITPNRESLRYNIRTNKCLQDKINLVRDEVLSYLKAQLNKDYPTVKEAVRVIRQQYFSLQLWKFKSYEITIRFSSYNLQRANVVITPTVRGVKVSSDVAWWYEEIIRYILPSSFYTYLYQNNTFKKSKDMALGLLLTYKLKYLDEPFKLTTKQYLSSQYLDSSTIFIRKSQVIIEYKKFLYALRRLYKTSPLMSPARTSFPKASLRLILEDLKSIFQTIEDFNNKDVPKAWLQSVKEKKAKEHRKCILYELEGGRGYLDDTNERSITTSNSYDLQYYLEAPFTIVYAEKGSKLLRFVFRIFRKIGYRSKIKFVETAKTNIKTIQTIKKFIPIEIFIQDNVILKRAFTGKYISEYIKDDFYVYSVFSWNDTSYQLYKKALRYIRSQDDLNFKNNEDKSWLNAIYQLYLQKGWLDYCVINNIQNKNLIKLIQFISKFRNSYNTMGLQEQIAINYFIYKHKIHLYELNPVTAYKQLKELTND